MGYFSKKHQEYKNKDKRAGMMGLMDISSIGVFGLLSFFTNNLLLVSSLGSAGYYLNDYYTTESGIKFIAEIRDNFPNEQYKNALFSCALRKGVNIQSAEQVQACAHEHVKAHNGTVMKADDGYIKGYGTGIGSESCAKLDAKCTEDMKKVLDQQSKQ